MIGSTCIFQGEELGLEDASDIPLDQLQDPWGIEFAPTFLGRDTCRTPMVWDSNEPNGGFSTASRTWLPVLKKHLKRCGMSQVGKPDTIYREFSSFLKWRKDQPALMTSNEITTPTGGPKKIIFMRKSKLQTLRCSFDFEKLIANFEEI